MNTEDIKETLDTEVNAITVEIPVRVTMTSLNGAPFEFRPSIDEVGQIVLTPTSKDVEFIDANTHANVEYDIPVRNQEDVTTVEGNLTTKETSIVVTASMLSENDNNEFSAVVDEIGQVIIYPLSKENIFVTASFKDSLNLVTEDLKVVEYCGYKLMNNGDGWDIRDSSGELVETGVATENRAKIVVCQTELQRLQGLSEELINDNAKEDDENTEADELEPEIEAEVITESRTSTPQILSNITNEFTATQGAVSCDTTEELDECIRILNNYYMDVNVIEYEDKEVVYYSNLKDTELNND